MNDLELNQEALRAAQLAEVCGSHTARQIITTYLEALPTRPIWASLGETMDTPLNHLGIDAPTESANEIIRRLKRLRTTTEVMHGGQYHQDRNYCQIHLTTKWGENDLERWLYAQKGIDYVGVFELTLVMEAV